MYAHDEGTSSAWMGLKTEQYFSWNLEVNRSLPGEEVGKGNPLPKVREC